MVTSYSQKSDGTVIGAAQLKLPRAVHWPRIVGTERQGELTLALSVFGALMADVSTACG
jgi:hypothetical protein